MQFVSPQTQSLHAQPGAPGDLATPAGTTGLFNTRYATMAANTIDYWMLPDDDRVTSGDVLSALERAPVLDEATLQIYIHVPFCAQRCRFCAFSGGNSLDFREAERYARLVVEQLRSLLDLTRIKGRPIRSVNIGGGSPDLLNGHVGHVLRAVHDLPGCSRDTEISVELTLSTARPEFIEELVRYISWPCATAVADRF